MPKPAPILRHKTPNYRQVGQPVTISRAPGLPDRKQVFYTWQPVPLRASRKDLNAA